MARAATASTPVRCHVFFIAGFDPKSPRWYHALYRNQARRQARVSGFEIEVGRSRSQPSAVSSAWTVDLDAAEGNAHTCYEMLQWDDLVRANWPTSAWRVLIDGVRTVSFGLLDGAVQRMYRLFRPPVYATFFPLVVLLLCGLLAIVLGAALLHGLRGQQALPGWLPPLAAAGFVVLLMTLALRLVHRIQITWLLRLVRFTHRQACAEVLNIDARIEAFAERIATVAAADDASRVDRILIVGHSVGATLAISVVARLLDRLASSAAEAADAPGMRPTIELLSLGHCIPLMSSLSPAQALRDDLQRVAQSAIDWVDFTAPIDWAAFPAVDPVGGAGLPPPPAGWHPLLLSPRFHQLFGAASYARLKRNRFQVHLQYLMASEKAGPYDFFALTAGPLTLRKRFAGHAETAAAATEAE